tara:strand:+ start:2751 stop:4418 length:1668 start_codon:yes stop_codon:yes gene_type:complete
MIKEVPYYFGIILLQIFSSFITFIGLPLLIPAIDFAQGLSLTNSEVSEQILSLFQYFQISPTFGSILIVLTILFISAEFTKLCASLLGQYTRLKISTDIRKKLISTYLKLSWTEINNNKSGNFNDSVIRQADLAGFSNLNAIRIAINSIQLVTYLFLSFYISPLITLIALAVFGFISLVNMINHVGHNIQAIKFQSLSENLALSISDLIINNKYYKTTSLFKAVIKPIKTISNMFKSYFNLSLREEGQAFWIQSISFIFLVTVMFNHNKLGVSFAELLLIVIIFQRLSPSFSNVQKSILDWKRDLPAYDAIKDRLKKIENTIEPLGGSIINSKISIRFENVHFSYNENNSGFKGISLNFESNKTTVIIGKSGSGKTTLIDLCLGLIRPDKGQIFYNNIAHDDIDYNQLRSKIAYVGQGISLIDGTVYENLVLHEDSLENITNAKIKKSLSAVGLLDFFMEKEQGLNFGIGENGSKLSGGQKQRLLIARGLLRGTEIFILDEPTSNLDTGSQNEVYKAIKSLQNKVTIILITHSIKFTEGVDIIYKVDNGKITRNN